MFAKCLKRSVARSVSLCSCSARCIFQHFCFLENAAARAVASCASTDSVAGSCHRRDSMKCLYVLFDADGELCVRCRNWLMQQRAFVPLVFTAFSFWSRRPRRMWSAIHFVDSRVRFRSRHAVFDRQSRFGGSRKHLFPKSAAEFGIHARIASSLGSNDRSSVIKLDAGGRRVLMRTETE